MNKARAAAKTARFTPMTRNMSITSVRMDEDEMSAFLRGSDFSCPFSTGPATRNRVVRKQM